MSNAVDSKCGSAAVTTTELMDAPPSPQTRPKQRLQCVPGECYCGLSGCPERML